MKILSFVLSFIFCYVSYTAPLKSHWNGKNVAFLGDSITDKIHVGTEKNYWQFLQEYLEIIPHVYGINGHTFKNILKQANRLKEENPNIDAILIFAGTNDYNKSVPLGEWYSFKDEKVEVEKNSFEIRKRRIIEYKDSTFKGRINTSLKYLKENFPHAQIILLTPIHRGYAKFSEKNVQPDESFPNGIGLYVDSYVNAIKEAGNVWAVPVIDLNSICGLYPNTDSNKQFFADKNRDLLHPNIMGHKKIAKALMYKLQCLASDMK